MNTPKPQIETTTCRSCGAVIWWGKTKYGKPAPFNVVDGEPTDENHFITCPDRREWRHQ